MSKLFGMFKCECLVPDTKWDNSLYDENMNCVPRIVPATPHKIVVSLPVYDIGELHGYRNTEDFTTFAGTLEKRIQKMYDDTSIRLVAVAAEVYDSNGNVVENAC